MVTQDIRTIKKPDLHTQSFTIGSFKSFSLFLSFILLPIRLLFLMTLLTPSLISPTTSKLLSYLSFNSSTNNSKTHVQSSSSKSPDIPTYITIVMRKDGTPTTKCLNPTNIDQTPTLSRPSSLLARRRRSSFSSSQCLSSPPKQRRLMISSLIPRFNVSPRRTNSNNSISSYNSTNSISVGDRTTMVTADLLLASQRKVACQFMIYSVTYHAFFFFFLF